MRRPNKKSTPRSSSKKNQTRKVDVPILRVRKGATRKERYAAARRAFTAADLQKYTEIEEYIPARQILAELKALDREDSRMQKGKRKNGGSR
jgi:hypothetical protein